MNFRSNAQQGVIKQVISATDSILYVSVQLYLVVTYLYKRVLQAAKVAFRIPISRPGPLKTPCGWCCFFHLTPAERVF